MKITISFLWNMVMIDTLCAALWYLYFNLILTFWWYFRRRHGWYRPYSADTLLGKSLVILTIDEALICIHNLYHYHSYLLKRWKKVKSLLIDVINSMWLSGAIRLQGFWSVVVQVMACCLTAPSHYLNHCWLISKEILWHSFQSDIYFNYQAINPHIMFDIYTC